MQIELNENECRLLIDVLGDVAALYKRELGRASRRVGEPYVKESRHVFAHRHNLLTGVVVRMKSALASMRALERAKAKNGGNDE